MKKKNSLFLYIILIATAALVVLRLLSTSSKPSRANQPKINILMVPKTGTISVGEQKVVTIVLQPADAGNKITGFDFNLKSVGNMEIQSLSEPLNLDTNDSSAFTKLVKESNTTSGRMSYVVLQGDATLPSRVQIQVTVTAAQSQYTNGILQLDGNTAQFVGNITGNMYMIGQIEQAEYNLAGDITPTIFITSPTPTGAIASPTNGPTVTPLPSGFPTLTPTRIAPSATPTSRPGSSPTGSQGNPSPTSTSSCPRIASPVQPKPFGLFTPGTTTLSWQAVSGASKYAIRIDDIGNGWLGYFELKGDLVDDNVMTNMYTYTFESGHAYRWWVHAISSCGRWSAPLESYVYVPPTLPTLQPGTPTPTGGSTGATPTPTALPPGYPTLTPTPTLSSSVPTATPTSGIPTVTPTPSVIQAQMDLNLKLRFQGVIKSPKPANNHIKADVIIFKDDKQVTKLPTEFQVDANGIALGRVSFSGKIGYGYQIYIDGAKHLKRKFCDISPRETNPGEYKCGDSNMSLGSSAGTNTINLDFSRITIFAGDVKGVGTYPPDGVIDSVDLTVISQHFGNRIEQGQNINQIITDYDLNLDGRIDTQDYSLAVFAMLIQRTDE